MTLGTELSKSTGRFKSKSTSTCSKLEQGGRPALRGSEAPKVVPIGTQGNLFQYIRGTCGPLVFCMWTACKGRCPTYGCEPETFFKFFFRQSDKEYYSLSLCRKTCWGDTSKFLLYKLGNVPYFVLLKCTVLTQKLSKSTSIINATWFLQRRLWMKLYFEILVLWDLKHDIPGFPTGYFRPTSWGTS